MDCIDKRAAIIGAVAATTAYLGVKSFLLTKAFEDIPMPPVHKKGLLAWFLGNPADELTFEVGPAGTLHREWITKPLEQLGVCRVLRRKWMFAAHPADVEHLLVTNAANYEKDVAYEVLLGRLLGEGLVTLIDVDRHAVHRKHLAPAFSPTALEHISDAVVPKFSAALRAQLSNAATQGTEIVFHDLIGEAAMGIMGEAIFRKTTPQDFTGKEFVEALQSNWNMARFIPGASPFLFQDNRRVDSFKAHVQTLVDKLIALNHQCQKEGSGRAVDGETTTGGDEPKPRTALIDYLIEADVFDRKAITDHSVTFMFAAFDTTQNTLNWLIYCLAVNQDKQQHLREELQAYIGLGVDPSVKTLRGCSYLASCLKETLRVYTPVYVTARITKEDDVLPGTKTFIPKGTPIDAAFWRMHHAEEIWGEDVEEFRPERWEEDPHLEEKVGCGFSPFSHGRRNCIGKDFAWNELLILAAVVIRNFRVEWPKGQAEPFPINFPVLRPRDPFRVQFIPVEE